MSSGVHSSHNRVREQAQAFASVLHDASAIIWLVKLTGAATVSSHESSGTTNQWRRRLFTSSSRLTPRFSEARWAMPLQLLQVRGEPHWSTTTMKTEMSPSPARDGPATVADEGEGTTPDDGSRFWGVTLAEGEQEVAGAI